MNIAIFGSTGSVGRSAVAQALAAGHQVTAFTRTGAHAEQAHPELRVVKEDV